MLDYLDANGFVNSFDTFKLESNLQDLVLDSNAKYSGLLQKKWTSVIRLQKKVVSRSLCQLILGQPLPQQIMELEVKNAQLTEELASTPSKKLSANSIDWMPKLPPRRSLLGHRSAITALAFHPIYNLLASASEDASVRIWDWDTGDNEKTLKGHTKSVQDVHFDSKGNFLGILMAFLLHFCPSPCLAELRRLNL